MPKKNTKSVLRIRERQAVGALPVAKSNSLSLFLFYPKELKNNYRKSIKEEGQPPQKSGWPRKEIMAETMSNDNNQKNRSQEPQAQIAGIPRNELEKQIISSFLLNPSLVSKHSLNPSELTTKDLCLLYQAIVKAKDDGSIDWGLLVRTPTDPSDPIVDLIDEQCEKLAKIAGVESWLVRKVATILPAPIDCNQYIARLRELNKASPKNYIKMVGKKGNRPEVDTDALVNDLKAEFTFKTFPGVSRDEILVYQNGVYIYNGEKVIKEQCEKRVPTPYAPLLTTHIVNEVQGHIARSTFVDRKLFDTDEYIINLENGLLNLITRELIPHSPEFLFTIRIPVSYDPDTECPKIMKFLGELLPNEDDHTVYEELGGSLLRRKYFPQKATIFYGSGANGKSKALGLLSKFIGKENTYHLSLQEIEQDRFALAGLYRKLLNELADLSPRTIKTGMVMFTKLTGEDDISGDQKFRDRITFTNYAKLVFSAQKLPEVDVDTYAFWRRWIIINFPNKFIEGVNADENILEKITTSEELSGFLNHALDGLDRLRANGKFSYEKTVDEVAELWTLLSDSVKAFVEQFCNIGNGLMIPRENLYLAYKGFCKRRNIELLGLTEFGKKLRNVPGLMIGDKKHRVKGEEIRHYLNIDLNQDGEELLSLGRMPDGF